MKYYSLLLVFILFSCKNSKTNPIADTIFINGTIYTMDDAYPVATAVAIKADTFLYVGNRENMETYIGAETNTIDLKGKTMIPGLVEGHAHIMGIGYNLLNVDLRKAKSYQEVVEMVAKRAENTPKGAWITGRGWHQDKWTEKPEMTNGFPRHDLLSKAIPDHPVYIKHASGHLSLANAKAMEVAKINSNTPQPNGGEIFMSVSGEPTGIFNETAQRLISNIIPKATKESDEIALKLALKHCFENGITGFHQAGSGEKHINLYKNFAKKGDLKIRLYVLLNGQDQELLKDYFKKGIEENLYDNQLTIRAIKLYADGALGSRGAWLLDEYADASGIHGHNIIPMDTIEAITKNAYQAGFQVGVHAIGDRAVREVLDVYQRVLQEDSTTELKDARFRIEHAQHFHPDDIPRFAAMNIIPAMQAIHLSSDRPWAMQRLGKQRIEWGAYMWQTLLLAGVKIVNGTDAPVEPLNPMANFYASVSRKTLKKTPKNGYEPAEKMSRQQALKSYTLDAAFGAFREKQKGSIQLGKWADLTILDQDIMTIPEEKILDTKVEMTVIGGVIVYATE